MNDKILMPPMHLRKLELSSTQYKIYTKLHESTSNIYYFNVARQQGTTSLFVEDIINGLHCGYYNNILVITNNRRSFSLKLNERCAELFVSDSDNELKNSIFNRIHINPYDFNLLELEIDKYDYILVDDFEFLNDDYNLLVRCIINKLYVDRRYIKTKLILVSAINDNFDFKKMKYRYIVRCKIQYEKIDPELSDSRKQEFLLLFNNNLDVYRREVLCKRKYEVENEPKPESKLDNIRSMTLQEIMDYCNDNDLEISFKIKKK